MNPFGGEIERGFDPTPERIEGMKEFFKSGHGVVELVESYASGDLAVLVVIERQRATVGDLDEQDWSLRVTLVYRREGNGWVIVHRHADPIVGSISVDQSARIARGDWSS
jgi:ketosteroid isomerase-like protein